MSVTSRSIPASAEDVFAVLSDGWTFASWVVGASRIRDVDEHWPQPGARIQHSVGSWPLLLDDHTAVEEMTPGRMLQMRARGWPAGEARIRIELQEQGTDTRVTITEDAVSGPGLLMPQVVRDVLLDWRNVETLQRLAYRVEGEVRRGRP
ncbi:MAG: SRPBCC family protein [Actinomycetota bacterium]|nr:SRPBCC family protein [Actinomycetota bacterium]